MSETIVVALITGVLSLIGSLAAQRRQTSLTIYRIDRLEKRSTSTTTSSSAPTGSRGGCRKQNTTSAT